MSSRKQPTAFVIAGRDIDARGVLCAALERLGLRPFVLDEFDGLKSPEPLLLNIISAIKSADLIVALFTPDESALLYPSLAAGQWEAGTSRARPNVVFEAGLAAGLRKGRFVIAKLGPVDIAKTLSDLAGAYYVDLANSAALNELAICVGNALPEVSLRTVPPRTSVAAQHLVASYEARADTAIWMHRGDAKSVYLGGASMLQTIPAAVSKLRIFAPTGGWHLSGEDQGDLHVAKAAWLDAVAAWLKDDEERQLTICFGLPPTDSSLGAFQERLQTLQAQVKRFENRRNARVVLMPTFVYPGFGVILLDDRALFYGYATGRHFHVIDRTAEIRQADWVRDSVRWFDAYVADDRREDLIWLETANFEAGLAEAARRYGPRID